MRDGSTYRGARRNATRSGLAKTLKNARTALGLSRWQMDKVRDEMRKYGEKV